MNVVIFIAQHTMYFTIPLLVVALGGLFSEKSGVVNIALEGIMIMGAFTGVLFLSFYEQNFHPQVGLLIALLIATVVGMLVSALHAFAAINLRANQIISGVAINMFAPGFAVFISKLPNVSGTQNIFYSNHAPRIDSVPILGDIPLIGPMFFQGTYFTVYLGIAILGISAFVLYKTKFGLRLRACGEHPQAADSVGVSVAKIRYAGVLISGALAGMGGVIWILPVSGVFNGTVSGYGFLALAVLIFGGWRPKKILFGALFFGIMQTIANGYSVIPFLAALEIPPHFYNMIPFIATLAVLGIASNKTTKNAAPKAIGEPYDKGTR